MDDVAPIDEDDVKPINEDEEVEEPRLHPKSARSRRAVFGAQCSGNITGQAES